MYFKKVLPIAVISAAASLSVFSMENQDEVSYSFFIDRDDECFREVHQNHIQKTVWSENYTGMGCGGGFPPSPPFSPRLYLNKDLPKLKIPKLELSKIDFFSSDDIRKRNEEAKIKDLPLQLNNHPVKILKYCFKENVSAYCSLKLIVKNLDADIPLDVVKYIGSFMMLNLVGADLSYADLSFENLMGLNLSEAKYCSADIEGAEMKKKDRIKANKDGAKNRFDSCWDEELYEPMKYNFIIKDSPDKYTLLDLPLLSSDSKEGGSKLNSIMAENFFDSNIDLDSLVYQPRVLAPFVMPPLLMPPLAVHNYNFANFLLPVNETIPEEVEENNQDQ